MKKVTERIKEFKEIYPSLDEDARRSTEIKNSQKHIKLLLKEGCYEIKDLGEIKDTFTRKYNDEKEIYHLGKLYNIFEDEFGQEVLISEMKVSPTRFKVITFPNYTSEEIEELEKYSKHDSIFNIDGNHGSIYFLINFFGWCTIIGGLVVGFRTDGGIFSVFILSLPIATLFFTVAWLIRRMDRLTEI